MLRSVRYECDGAHRRSGSTLNLQRKSREQTKMRQSVEVLEILCDVDLVPEQRVVGTLAILRYKRDAEPSLYSVARVANLGALSTHQNLTPSEIARAKQGQE